MKKHTKKIIWLFSSILFILIITFFLFQFINKEKKVMMIDFSGQTIEQVKQYSEKNKLELDIKYEYHEEIPEKLVIKQSILSGEKVKPKTQLTITISLGSETTLWKQNKVNELGRIPVMMYHGIHHLKDDDTAYTGGNVDQAGYQRTTESFRRDLEFYYQNGYRMIRLQDYINHVIDVELGKSPIVLTFDDGLKNNILVTGLDEKGDIIIDPNSAVGILEEFKQKYPDFKVTATFFVNGGIFDQPDYNQKILEWLVNHGYDIGNHTKTHVNFTKVDQNRSIEEVGYIYNKLEKMIPGKYLPIVALPFGTPYDKKSPNFPMILKGNYQGKEYTTSSTLRVGWESDISPFSKKFDSQFIKRIRAYDHNGTEFDIMMNFKMLEKSRYISDGNKDRIVIPSDKKEQVIDTTLEIKTYENKDI